jgi:3-(3-hydroxy-phenyl)propionate hydroxylase
MLIDDQPNSACKIADPPLERPVVTHTDSTLADSLPVLIVGGGPVGMTLAALLAEFGVRSLVLEADEGYCTGSRAICISRRSLEILAWIGADRPVVAKGLAWVGGRSYFRSAEVLTFRMPSEPSERFAPMFNIQQFYVEGYVHAAMQRRSPLCALRSGTRAVGVRPASTGVDVDVETAHGRRETLRARWLVACDGGHSSVREILGLSLCGTQYEGRYVIVDIEQQTKREVERLAWFDPPSNPGSTILMHRQPDSVWRIDYQLREGEDPDEAIRPENVLPRVQSHLEMIGETAPWKPLWTSIYNAKALTLARYRHGPVLFAGDAAHLVPIFGVRGLNSGFDDAGNLAWKLALVEQGAPDVLLDSYSAERVHATRENLAYGSKSTEFMAPPNYGFRLMREAALRLALVDERVRPLINPRQTAPVSYVDLALNTASMDVGFARGPRPGDPAPEASVQMVERAGHLTEQFGRGFVALQFAGRADAAAPAMAGAAPVPVRIVRIAKDGVALADRLIDHRREAWRRYDAQAGTMYLVRPDGYVLGRWRSPAPRLLAAALQPFVARASAGSTG